MPNRHTGAFGGGQCDYSCAAPASEFGLAREPERVTNLGDQCCGGDRFDAGFITQCGAMFVEKPVEVSFEVADLTSCGAVLIDERDQQRQPVCAGLGGHRGGVELLESAKPRLDLAGRDELVADLGGQFGDLIEGVVKHQGADFDEHSAVLEDRFNLGD